MAASNKFCAMIRVNVLNPLLLGESLFYSFILIYKEKNLLELNFGVAATV